MGNNFESESITPDLQTLKNLVNKMQVSFGRLGGPGESLMDREFDDDFEKSLSDVTEYVNFISQNFPQEHPDKYEKVLCDLVKYLSPKMVQRGFFKPRQHLQDILFELATTHELLELKKISHAIMNPEYFTFVGRLDRIIAKLTRSGKKKRVD